MTSNSAERLGEGEVAGPQPGGVARAEVGPGEGVDGAGQVAEGDALVDGQALDLVEHGRVAGVEGVAAVAAARHHRVDGRRAALHDPDLHGRGVGAEHDLFGPAELHVEGVPHRPGRVGGGHVEGFEVVPVGLHLGAFGHLVAEGEEDLLQLPLHLGDGVEVAPGRRSRPGGSGRAGRPARPRGGRRPRRRLEQGGHLGPERGDARPAAGRSVGRERLMACCASEVRKLRLPVSDRSSASQARRRRRPVDRLGGPGQLRVERGLQ